jgi:hypothetical protein
MTSPRSLRTGDFGPDVETVVLRFRRPAYEFLP